jgi:hypothetical protein
MPNMTMSTLGEAASAIDQDFEKPWIASCYQGLYNEFYEL